MEEFEFIVDFVKEADFGYDVCRKQLRSLWTAYCLHNNLDPDTLEYDTDISQIYNVVEQNNSCPWLDDEEEETVGFDLFDMFMGEELS